MLLLSEIKKRYFYRRYRELQQKSLQYGLNLTQNRKRRIVVSLTTYPKRFPSAVYCIKSLLDQTVKADIINLYLDLDCEIKDLPDEIQNLQKYGVTISIKREFAKQNIKPHKKYYFAMQEYPEDIVITADDDVCYPKWFIRKLLNSYNRYPNAVSAYRVHKMKYSGEEGLLPYNEWEFEYSRDRKPRFDLLATGVSGVLYPPHCMDLEVFNLDAIIELCDAQDDLWLKYMQLRKGTPVVYVPDIFKSPFIIPASQEESLETQNVQKCQNDIAIRKIESYYHITYLEYINKNTL